MPLYEYQCGACGERSEMLQKFSDDPATECPHCHESKLKRLISATHFKLKGTGWYATDFKDQGKPPAADNKESTKNKETQKTKDSDKGGDNKSDTKKTTDAPKKPKSSKEK